MTTHVKDTVLPNTSGTSTFTASVTSTAGHTLVLGFTAWMTANTPVHITNITDSAGNTWVFSTATANQNPPANGSFSSNFNQYGFTLVATCIGAAAITSVTVTTSASVTSFAEGAVSEFSSLPAGAVVLGGASSGTLAALATSYTTPSVSAPSSGAVLVVVYTSNFGGWTGVTSGYTILSVSDPLAAYNVAATAGTISVTLTQSTGADVPSSAVLVIGAPSSVAGAAALTASGTLTAAATQTANATGALTAAGTLAAAGSVTSGPAAALAATASLSAAATQTVHGSASLAAVSSLSAAAPSAVITVPASWSGSYAVPSGFFFPYPAGRPVQVAVANTPGDWMIAIITWRQAQAGEDVTVSVADDAHNWWEPLGAPVGDSSAAGVTRCSVWAAPAARAAQYVQVAASGPRQALAVRVLDVHGMQPWMTMTPVVTNYALAATSLSLSASAPSAQAFLVAAAGSDNNADTIGGPGAGWTSLGAVTASNGVDTTADITLSSAWRVTSASAAAAWTSSGALDFSGVIAGVLVSGTAPSQPNPNWPVVVTEIAPGSGAQTPPSLLTWTPLSARALSLSVQQGKQYTLSQLQAGQGTVIIDNPDGALIPPGTGAFAGIDSGTPIRQRAIIPGVTSPHNVAFSGYLQRWPFAVPDDMRRGETQATLTDAWGYAAGLLNSMAREEMLIDSPYACWPLDDPQGSAQGSNIAPGNSLPFTLTWSKYGAGGAAVAFGQNSGALIGDSSASISTAEGSGTSGGAEGMFSQTLGGTSLAVNGYGAALVCADPNYPAIIGGVTIETWFELVGYTGPQGESFSAATSGSLFSFSATIAAGSAVVLYVASGFTFPGGFSANTIYYLVNVSGQTAQLSGAPGGSAITVTSAGTGYIEATTPWDPVIISARNAKGPVVEIDVNNVSGALLLRYTPAGATTSTLVTVDSSRDYRDTGLTFCSVAFNQTAWRVITGLAATGAAAFSGTFSSALPAAFTELTAGGIQDRTVQGYAWTGYLALAAVYPQALAPVRSYSHYWSALAGMVLEAACDRVERVLEYAGLTGRRWLGQQQVLYEGDLVVSGQDIGGQGAATSAGNIQASTVPANLYVAPTGDIVYFSKLYNWNQPVRWTLGDNVAGGEIPFLPSQFSTDYDNARVVNDIQLTQLDTQTVTVPSGVMAGTTVAAVEAASEAQYGDQPLQQTGYLTYDATSPYNAGGSEVDLANWIADVYARPRNRVQAVTVNAAANAANASSQAAWQFWAGASVGDMVAVNVRLPTAAVSPLISLVARISQTNRAGQFSQDGTSATIACVLDFAPEYTVLTCDDPVRGLLNGTTNVLAW